MIMRRRKKQKTDQTDEYYDDLIKRMEKLNRGSLTSLPLFNQNLKNNDSEDPTKKNSFEGIGS